MLFRSAPDDRDALAAALSRALSDDGTRRDLIARGLARVGVFSWAQAAEEMAALYARVAGAA